MVLRPPFRTSTKIVAFGLAAPLFLACSGEEGVCHGVGPNGRDSCDSLAKKKACATENRTWSPYLPGDKAQHHWETSGVRTCNALGYPSCGPGGCSR